MPVQRPTACRAPRILACALALFLTGLVASAPRARASGYTVREGSADQTANAYAGDTAKAYDASTAFANPAGMVLLDQTQVEGDITAILPSFTFHGRDALAPGVDIPGRTGGSVVENAADPAYFAVISASPNLKFGIAVTAPFGQRVSNGTDFVGRYQSLVSSIADYEITLSAAYRINRYFSIGGGPVIDYFKARLTQAINTGQTAALTGDPVADIHGDPQINMGYNIGAMLMPSDQLRFGIDYRSRIDRSLNASQTVSVPALLAQLSPLTAYELSFLDSEVHTKIAQPDNLSLGAYWQVTPKLAVMSDVQWTDWSLFRHLVLTSANGLPPNVTPENWHDTWFGSIGASYRVLPALLLQAGLAYDESPVNSGNRTTRLPDYNRFFSGLGLTWSAARNVDVTIGWNHLFAAGAEIDTSASPSAGTLMGKYDNHAESVALGANVRF